VLVNGSVKLITIGRVADLLPKQASFCRGTGPDRTVGLGITADALAYGDCLLGFLPVGLESSHFEGKAAEGSWPLETQPQ
jgi:hypothetical protein